MNIENKTLKRDKADELYSIAVKRYLNEKPEVNLSSDFLSAIWFAIYGILCHEGENEAMAYVKSANLLDNNNIIHKTKSKI